MQPADQRRVEQTDHLSVDTSTNFNQNQARSANFRPSLTNPAASPVGSAPEGVSRFGLPITPNFSYSSSSAGRKAKFSGYSSPRYPLSPGDQSFSRASLTSTKDYGCLTHIRMTAAAKFSRFFKRLFDYRQMDFEFAFWQMLFLLAAPQKVYRNFMYRKRTKDQWARDDPAFLVLLGAVLLITSMIFVVVFSLSFGKFLKFFLWAVFVDCILSGLIIATSNWVITNHFLRRDKQQDVEWSYCFDVHLNAFFPILIFSHAIAPLFYPYLVFSKLSFILLFIGNSCWLVSVGYYLYITFLGFTALPFLKNTHIFLYPFTFLFIFYVMTVTIGWNITLAVMNFYYHRVV